MEALWPATSSLASADFMANRNNASRADINGIVGGPGIMFVKGRVIQSSGRLGRYLAERAACHLQLSCFRGIAFCGWRRVRATLRLSAVQGSSALS